MYNPGQAVSFTQILDDHSDGNVIDFIHHKLISHVQGHTFGVPRQGKIQVIYNNVPSCIHTYN